MQGRHRPCGRRESPVTGRPDSKRLLKLDRVLGGVPRTRTFHNRSSRGGRYAAAWGNELFCIVIYTVLRWPRDGQCVALCFGAESRHTMVTPASFRRRNMTRPAMEINFNGSFHPQPGVSVCAWIIFSLFRWK